MARQDTITHNRQLQFARILTFLLLSDYIFPRNYLETIKLAQDMYFYQRQAIMIVGQFQSTICASNFMIVFKNGL